MRTDLNPRQTQRRLAAMMFTDIAAELHVRVHLPEHADLIHRGVGRSPVVK